MTKSVAFLLVACLALCGCGSSPKTHFFTLQAVPPQSRAAGKIPALQVISVHIPAALDRQEMVRQAPSGELQVSDENRWGGPLDEMIQRALTQDLAARLPQGDVVFPQQPAPADTRQVVVDILQFTGDGAGHVALDASWSLLKSGASTPLLTRQLRLQESGGADYGADAEAMGRLIARLADDIVATVEKQPS
jgi:uncharacterized lipoprotein YmbA